MKIGVVRKNSEEIPHFYLHCQVYQCEFIDRGSRDVALERLNPLCKKITKTILLGIVQVFYHRYKRYDPYISLFHFIFFLMLITTPYIIKQTLNEIPVKYSNLKNDVFRNCSLSPRKPSED